MVAKRKVSEIHHRPLSAASAIARIRELWTEGSLLVLPHAQRRMRERDITMDHIGQVIHSGRFTESSRPGPGGNWRYSVQGHTKDGINVTCIIEPTDRLILVTVIDKYR